MHAAFQMATKIYSDVDKNKARGRPGSGGLRFEHGARAEKGAWYLERRGQVRGTAGQVRRAAGEDGAGEPEWHAGPKGLRAAVMGNSMRRRGRVPAPARGGDRHTSGG